MSEIIEHEQKMNLKSSIKCHHHYDPTTTTIVNCTFLVLTLSVSSVLSSHPRSLHWDEDFQNFSKSSSFSSQFQGFRPFRREEVPKLLNISEPRESSLVATTTVLDWRPFSTFPPSSLSFIHQPPKKYYCWAEFREIEVLRTAVQIS